VPITGGNPGRSGNTSGALPLAAPGCGGLFLIDAEAPRGIAVSESVREMSWVREEVDPSHNRQSIGDVERAFGDIDDASRTIEEGGETGSHQRTRW